MNFRKHITQSGTLIIAGKNAEQNEELLKKHAEKNDLVFHTASPGSPFCVIKGDADKKEIYETALFCARHSREYKKLKTKHDINVHYFNRKDIYKEKEMKLGTFGVKKFKIIKAKKQDIEGI